MAFSQAPFPRFVACCGRELKLYGCFFGGGIEGPHLNASSNQEGEHGDNYSVFSLGNGSIEREEFSTTFRNRVARPGLRW